MAAQQRDELIPCVYKLLAPPYEVFEIFAFSEVWAKCWGCDGVTLSGDLL